MVGFTQLDQKLNNSYALVNISLSSDVIWGGGGYESAVAPTRINITYAWEICR